MSHLYTSGFVEFVYIYIYIVKDGRTRGSDQLKKAHLCPDLLMSDIFNLFFFSSVFQNVHLGQPSLMHVLLDRPKSVSASTQASSRKSRLASADTWVPCVSAKSSETVKGLSNGTQFKQPPAENGHITSLAILGEQQMAL